MLKLFKPSLPALLLLLGVLAPACLACNDECRLQDSDCDDDYEVCIDAEHFDSIKTHCDASAYMCQSCVRSCTTSDGTCTIQHTGCNQRYKSSRNFSQLAGWHTECIKTGSEACSNCIAMAGDYIAYWDGRRPAASLMYHECLCYSQYNSCIGGNPIARSACRQECIAAKKEASKALYSLRPGLYSKINACHAAEVNDFAWGVELVQSVYGSSLEASRKLNNKVRSGRSDKIGFDFS